MSPMTGKLIDGLLKEKGLRHKDLAQATGFTTNYVSNVVSKQEGSTRFLKVVEKEMELEPGSLVQWNLLEAINKICRKEGIPLDDAVSWLERAARTFRAIRSSNALPKDAEPSHHQESIAAPPRQEQPAETENMTVKLSKWLRANKHYVNLGGGVSRATTPFYFHPVLSVFDRMTLPHSRNLIIRSAA